MLQRKFTKRKLAKQQHHTLPYFGMAFYLATSICGVFFGVGCSAPADTANNCSDGSTRSCASSGCIGTQSCNSLGNWQSCSCPAKQDRANDTLRQIGNACKSDSDCSAGAFCLLPQSNSWFGGGPPQGICSADCTSNADACLVFSSAICIQSNSDSQSTPKNALCFRSCTVGKGSVAQPSCSSTGHQACELVSSASNTGFCRPFCVFDGDCVTNHCDRRSGACVAEAPPVEVSSFADSCSSSGSGCSGVCLSLADGYSVCTHRCAYGNLSDCSVKDSDPTTAVCAYSGMSSGLGDLGYCAQLCNCNDQCSAAGFICSAFGDTALVQQLGAVGICAPGVDSSGTRLVGTPCH